jgi:hypothetical protein
MWKQIIERLRLRWYDGDDKMNQESKRGEIMSDLERLRAEALTCGFDPDVGEIWEWWVGLEAQRREEFVRTFDPRWQRYSWQADEEGMGHWVPVASVRGEKLLRAYGREEKELLRELNDFEQLVDWASDWESHYDHVGRTFHVGCAGHVAAGMLKEASRDPRCFLCPKGLEDCPVKAALMRGRGR